MLTEIKVEVYHQNEVVVQPAKKHTCPDNTGRPDAGVVGDDLFQ